MHCISNLIESLSGTPYASDECPGGPTNASRNRFHYDILGTRQGCNKVKDQPGGSLGGASDCSPDIR